MVPSGVQATPTLTDTNALRTESRLEVESDERVSSQTFERTTTQENCIAAIGSTTTERGETSYRGSTAEQIPVPIVNLLEQRIARELFGIERTVISVGRASVGHGDANGNDNGT